jgi:ABC-type multidrug transport system ATPase subunit
LSYVTSENSSVLFSAAGFEDYVMPLICDNIAFTYPEAAHPLFSGVSFQLMLPGFHSFFGPSGVGKTSLAKIITGNIGRFSGTVSTAGLKTLLYSYNTERLPGWSSVARHLARVIPPAMHDRKDELVDIFGLSDSIGSRFNRLSMGQQNRVNLIRYLLQDCDLLIMDESLANVDELTREKIILAIKALFPKRYFIYISHNVMEVAKFCDSILVFRSTDKTPQTVMVKGSNLHDGETLSRMALDATLLEIMNAA